MQETGLEYVTWDFERVNEKSIQLADDLHAKGVELAIPLYEQSVEWAGALNGEFRNNRKQDRVGRAAACDSFALFGDKGTPHHPRGAVAR